MKSWTVLASAAGPVAIATAHTGHGTITEIFTEWTTVCPSPTTWAYHNTTYTITSSTTITLCRHCTVSITQPPPTTYTTTYVPTANASVPYANTTLSRPPTTITSIVTVTPQPTTHLVGTSDVSPPPPPSSSSSLSTPGTKTPVGPTSLLPAPSEIPTAGAAKAGVAALGLALAGCALALLG